MWGKAREGDGQRWVTGLGFTRHLTQGATSWQQAWVKHNTSVCVFVCTSARVTFCVSTCVHVIAHVCSVHECAHMLCVHSCVHAPVCAFVCTHVCVCSENRPAHAHGKVNQGLGPTLASSHALLSLHLSLSISQIFSKEREWLCHQLNTMYVLFLKPRLEAGAH